MSYFLILTVSGKVHMQTVDGTDTPYCNARYRSYRIFAIVGGLPTDHTVCADCVANSGVPVEPRPVIANRRGVDAANPELPTDQY